MGEKEQLQPESVYVSSREQGKKSSVASGQGTLPTGLLYSEQEFTHLLLISCVPSFLLEAMKMSYILLTYTGLQNSEFEYYLFPLSRALFTKTTLSSSISDEMEQFLQTIHLQHHSKILLSSQVSLETSTLLLFILLWGIKEINTVFCICNDQQVSFLLCCPPICPSIHSSFHPSIPPYNQPTLRSSIHLPSHI